MLYELRIYTVKPGVMPEYLRIVGEVGMPIRKNDYGTLVGAWSSEIGLLNQYYHLWSYPDAAERTRLRAALAKAPGWADTYLAQTRGMVVAQENQLWTADEEIGVRPVEGSGHVYELRTYRAMPGQIPVWAKLFKEALPAREKYSQLVGLWTGEVGGLNAANHLWVYDDLKQRAEVRTTALQDPVWAEYVPKGSALLTEMRSTILLPAPFSPLR